MGYYQTAYPIYLFLLVFSTDGAPAAISKMTSERIVLGHYREDSRVFKLAFVLMGAIGVIAAAICFFGAKPLVNVLGNPGACLLYTSDAADEEDSVDLGGRRIIKKKKKK